MARRRVRSGRGEGSTWCARLLVVMIVAVVARVSDGLPDRRLQDEASVGRRMMCTGNNPQAITDFFGISYGTGSGNTRTLCARTHPAEMRANHLGARPLPVFSPHCSSSAGTAGKGLAAGPLQARSPRARAWSTSNTHRSSLDRLGTRKRPLLRRSSRKGAFSQPMIRDRDQAVASGGAADDAAAADLTARQGRPGGHGAEEFGGRRCRCRRQRSGRDRGGRAHVC